MGLGETVIQGMVDPDEYQVFKPLLDDVSLRPIIEKALGGKAQKLVYITLADLSGEAMHMRFRAAASARIPFAPSLPVKLGPVRYMDNS